MKVLAAIVICCVTLLACVIVRSWFDYAAEREKLSIQREQLQLDILKYIHAQQERLEHEKEERGPLSPVPQKPSLELKNLRG